MRKLDPEPETLFSGGSPWWERGKLHEPIIVPRNDGLTHDERFDRAEQAMDELIAGGFDFDFWKRLREQERGIPYESIE